MRAAPHQYIAGIALSMPATLRPLPLAQVGCSRPSSQPTADHWGCSVLQGRRQRVALRGGCICLAQSCTLEHVRLPGNSHAASLRPLPQAVCRFSRSGCHAAADHAGRAAPRVQGRRQQGDNGHAGCACLAQRCTLELIRLPSSSGPCGLPRPSCQLSKTTCMVCFYPLHAAWNVGQLA